MKKNEAIELVKDTFDQKFNEDVFHRLIANLLNEHKVVNKEVQSEYVRHAFLDYVLKYKVHSEYTDPQGKNIHVLQVILKQSSTLLKARTAQRNFVADYLRSRNLDAALVAFLAPNEEDWRFSLVKIEYSLNVEEGKVKTEENLTPAKRWSFLVGKNEGSHTAQQRLNNLLIDKDKPTLTEIEQAFDVERVTDEFFEKYKELYFGFKEKLDELVNQDEKLKKDFKDKEIDTADFSKKTLGQIVFLYFLQKKGWFGIPHDKSWGEGPKNFIRALYKRRDSYGNNFFNDILEPLFYEALATDRGEKSIYPRLNNTRMPFLNGGLFEPINDYNWEVTNIEIPDDIFSNENKTKEGDIGDGILDIFDRYNFTVNENEPLEKEVAVDPEMLGKVFENLLEIKERKDKGSFYTPREIVHYMCRESLINYLENETEEKIPHEDLEDFIYNGAAIIENDKQAIKKIREHEKKVSKYENPEKFKYSKDRTYQLQLPKSIINNARELDKLLANIKVADPAVGSGAFPLGMINEIVMARRVLGIYISTKHDSYDLKLHAISNSIHGVDIDPGAVEIAKLRLWLSLVVEEKEPHPLPNLDHRIMQGNSLLSEYEGIKLFDSSLLNDATKDTQQEIDEIEERLSKLQKEFFDKYQNEKLDAISKKDLEKQIGDLNKRRKSLLTPTEKPSANKSLFDVNNRESELRDKALKLEEKIKQYVGESRKSHKESLKKEIDNLKWDLIEETLRDQGKLDKLKEVKNLRHKNIKPFFIWELEFSEVFRDKGGFDVVIGNPPYIKEYTSKSAFDGLRNSPYYMGKMDLWYFFACYGLDLLKKQGIQSFIAPNNWITNHGAKIMRDKLLKESTLEQFIDFGNYKVFDTAGIQTMVYVIEKTKEASEYVTNYGRLKIDSPTSEDLHKFLNYKSDSNNRLFEKYHVKLNREKLIGSTIQFLHPKIQGVIKKIETTNNTYLGNNELAQGIVIPQDFLNKKNKEKLGNDYSIGDGIFVVSDKEKKELMLKETENALLKPYFMTPNFSKYFTNKSNKHWIIYTDSKFKDPNRMSEYPSLKRHLDQYGMVITSDNKPYGLHRARDERFFLGEKIVVARKCIEPAFSYNDFECYVSATFYVIKTKRLNLKYLTAVLNSKLVKFWLRYKGKMQGNNYQLDKEPLMQIPIKKISNTEQNRFVEVIDQILELTKEDDYDPKSPSKKQKELESKIDQMVYELYGLTDEEIQTVEESMK